MANQKPRYNEKWEKVTPKPQANPSKNPANSLSNLTPGWSAHKKHMRRLEKEMNSH